MRLGARIVRGLRLMALRAWAEEQADAANNNAWSARHRADRHAADKWLRWFLAQRKEVGRGKGRLLAVTRGNRKAAGKARADAAAKASPSGGASAGARDHKLTTGGKS